VPLPDKDHYSRPPA